MGLNAEMAGDQRFDDAQSVCFEVECPHGLTLLGAADLALTLSADATHGFVVARLCDVAPDGASVRIAHGILNLHHRTDPPSPMTPGAPMQVALTLDQMAYDLAPGHRLRLALSNSYWPFVWPSPLPVSLHLTGGTLTLPVHEGAAPGWAFAEAPPVAPTRLRMLSAGHDSRTRTLDEITGTERITITSDSGLTENPDHGLQTRTVMTEEWQIHPDDPLSASCAIRWEQSFARGDWSVTTEVRARQTGTATSLDLDAQFTASIKDGNEVPEIIERNFVAQVARDRI
jgi:hypothetical protein